MFKMSGIQLLQYTTMFLTFKCEKHGLNQQVGFLVELFCLTSIINFCVDSFVHVAKTIYRITVKPSPLRKKTGNEGLISINILDNDPKHRLSIHSWTDVSLKTRDKSVNVLSKHTSVLVVSRNESEKTLWLIERNSLLIRQVNRSFYI